MIAGFYGFQLPLEQARSVCQAGRDGVNARIILDSAHSIGLPLVVQRLELEDLSRLVAPAILHWQFNHFVVFEKCTSRSFVIFDPARGRLKLTFAEVDSSFTGVALLCDDPTKISLPPRTFAKRQSAHSLRLIKEVLKKEWFLSGQLLVCSVILQIVGLLFPICLRFVLHNISTTGPRYLYHLGVLIGLGACCFCTANLLRGVFAARLRASFDETLATTFMTRILQLPYVFTQHRPAGDLLVRLESNRVLRDFALGTLITVLLDASLTFGYLMFLLISMFPVGVLVFLASAAQVAFGLLASKMSSNQLNAELSAHSKQHGMATEILTALPLIKATGAEQRITDIWGKALKDHILISEDRSLRTAISDSMLSALRLVIPPLALLVGLERHSEGRASIDTVIVLSAVSGMLASPLNSILHGLYQLANVRLHSLRIDDILREERADVQTISSPAIRLKGEITVNDLSYQFSPNSTFSLSGISLHCSAGSLIGLVGPTGSGKSTLMSILSGLYKPTNGEILLDGLALQDRNETDLRSQIGIVFQDPFFFSGTLRHNFDLLSGINSDDQLMESCWLAGIDEFVRKLPMGFDTVITSWNTVSGGERQRLAIARAIVHRPTILFLDEATSHLDVITEALVHERLSALRCTRVVIAHRLKTIQNADMVYVLRNGRICDYGTHSTLREREGYYRTCLTSQTRDTSKGFYA